MNVTEVVELGKALGLNVKCIMYTALESMPTLKNDCDGYVILVQYSDTIGHFVCTYFYKGDVFFFDSFGRKKNYFENLHNQLVQTGRSEYTRSLYFDLLRRSNITRLNWFDYKIQDDKSKLCGVWCLLRIKHKSMSDLDFYTKFKNKEKQLADDADKKLKTRSYGNWFF